MSNRKVSLLWYCRTPRGWRRFPIVLGKNNRIRHSAVIDSGVEVSYPDGHYEVLYYDGRKPRYKNVGTNAADAMVSRDREAHLLSAKESAVEAGATVVEEEKRVYIRRAAGMYIQDAENRNAMEAAGQARLVTQEFMDVSRKTFVDEITKEDVYRFHKALRERGMSDRTVANKHARLKSFLNFAGVNVKTVVPPEPKFENKLPTIYTREEIKTLRSIADPYLKMVIDLAHKLGLRDQEIMHAEYDDIDWEHSVFRVTGKVDLGFKIKDSEQREIPIPRETLSALKAWRKTHNAKRLIVGTVATDNPNRHLLRTLKRTARRNKLNCGRCNGCLKVHLCQEWTLHKFRRTCITAWLRGTVDLKTVQAYAGHANLESTMRYLRPASSSEMQKKIDAIVWE